ncbi:TPA: type I toxin-antitoxin system Ibs family toxin [Salmonella enterica subsp. enterica serovar Paratyphi C]|nr:type I toxin-antitoxin system Ibs family toxin [Salmonella enterica subsp. enterica serovar Paratyphi C]
MMKVVIILVILLVISLLAY